MNERGYDFIFHHTKAHEGGTPSTMLVPTTFPIMYPLVLTTNHHLTNPPKQPPDGARVSPCNQE